MQVASQHIIYSQMEAAACGGSTSQTWWCMPCRYDGTVRNSAGDVVQFLYGEDGMDGVRIEGQVRMPVWFATGL